MKLPNGYGGITKLSGNRRRPYVVRKTVGLSYDSKRERYVQEYKIIGYTATRSEGLQLLARYNINPVDQQPVASITFSQVYDQWSKLKYEGISKSNIAGYENVYKLCAPLYFKQMCDLRLTDLQFVVDTCGKNYPILKKLNVLFHQVFEYAMKNEYITKDYSQYVDISAYKNKNPNKQHRDKISEETIQSLWQMSAEPTPQIILMLIYSGVRVSELLDLKKENVHLEEQYFDVIESKTENGIRKVPIADKVLRFYQYWYKLNPNNKYLLQTPKGEKFLYRNFYLHYFKPVIEGFQIDATPHCCRHTCITLLAEAHVEQTLIKRIVGHTGAMSLTEKVYIHFDIADLVKAINKI